ncbi:hypothetical protein B5F76_05765 [Desulfovibrio sp. An276]|uniref:hypothetical protein n=1 Tax=Desulfovibrio sp. An276 TaxID=1965618 RepID=UPI000B37211D|nr:hypothetical protein [Desulfovibrio sp. An276]OUO53283.1 hypothetical protein B5F76_05765 [Desulfovibrio sp. An276]
MSFSPIKLIESQEQVVTDPTGWIKNYKEQFVEHFHDTSQLTFIHPDDCLIVAGPPRLNLATGSDSFHTIGFVNAFQYTETRSVQPLKAIGSRRHVFGITNAPVQISMSRMMIVGRNLLNSFYANASFGQDVTNRNSKYDIKAGSEEGTWWTNLEEDVFRVPFGLGVIWDAPATLASSSTSSRSHAAAEYFEVCTLVNRSQAIQSGQAVLMENVSMMADRVVPWSDYGSAPLDKTPELLTNLTQMG